MVSIIIPVYNVSEYIGQCFDSILGQTYKDIEVIAIDDGSTDNSLDIINMYKDKFYNMKILIQENKGQAEARNIGLKNANGEFILFIDADDFLNESMIEKLVYKINESNADIAICSYYEYYEEKDKKLREVDYNIKDKTLLSSDEVIDMILNYKLEGQLWNKLFRRSQLLYNKFSLESGRYIEDIFPVFKMVVKSSNIIFVNEPLYYYRQRNTSTMKNKSKKLYEDYHYSMNLIIKYINKEKIDVDNNSLKVFRATVLSRFIAMYTDYINYKVYKTFYNSNFVDLNIRYSDFLTLRNLSNIDKIRIILWKTRLFYLIKKINKFKENYIKVRLSSNR